MKHVNLQSLDTLCCIARLGTFQAAASHLNATQPTISGRIRDLENAVGVALFQRQGRRMVLTIQGRELVRKVEPLLRSLDDALVSLDNPAAASGIVRIGAGEIVALSWLPTLVGQLKTLMPKVTYEIEVDLTVNMRHRLENGQIDIAIVAAPIALNQIDSISLGAVPMCWTIAPALKATVAERKLAPGELLAAFPVWSLHRPSAIFPMTTSALREFGVEADSIDTSDNMLSIVKMIVNGCGIALLPRVLVQEHLARGELELLCPKLPEPELEFVVAWNTEQAQSTIKHIVKMAVAISTFSGMAGATQA
ncbi:LysR family transcriptional regulator [Bordetella sp. BOR01]|uniref:LysR family transcriptional regulator n=1 Tax=Bordetella sp. BOR01 TaxID=2854779 RepID=UPI002107FA41|nr:LysR family transcriptional regulator [Bordetella sp. BOR01]